MGNPLQELFDRGGVSVWYDSLSREMIKTGALQKMIDEDGLRGQTSNPSIFQSSISKGKDYDQQSLDLAKAGKSTEEIAWELMISDVQSACDVFRPLYDSSQGQDGFVSLELHPGYAHETQKSIDQGRDLVKRVNRPNLMIKVPGTPEGLPVIKTLLSEGVNVNITLLFSTNVHDQVMDLYMQALEKRLAEGQPIDRIASVASFFVSRVDTEADKRLDKRAQEKPELSQTIKDLHGKVAVANAQRAYRHFLAHFSGPRWEKLEKAGARVQRPLWASTSTKNKSYSDTLYVHELIGPHTVNTMPLETIVAWRDHGRVETTLTPDKHKMYENVLARLEEVGVDLDDICLNTLVAEGVKKFADSFTELLSAVEKNVHQLQHS